MFAHEKLHVYAKALDFGGKVAVWTSTWSQGKAQELPSRLFRQLDEAGTSIALNIAEGNGRYAELDHQHFLHLAQTAAVKAAVYLDLGTKRSLWSETEVAPGKEHLRRVNLLLGGF